jgi:hypothetical protein
MNKKRARSADALANRGLDNAAEMYKINDIMKLQVEHNRNCLKARTLLEGSDTKPALLPAAMEVINRKVSLPWWKLAKIA